MHSSAPGSSLALAAISVFALACSDTTQPDTYPAEPHRAASVRLISGGGQTGVVGTNLPQQIVLEVLDSVGKPAWGRPIYGVPNTAPGSVLTDRSGHVTFTWPLGPGAGTQTLTLDPGGQDHDDRLVVTVSATALARPFHHATPWSAIRTSDSWLNTTPLTRDQLFAPRDTFDNAVSWPADVALVPPSGWTVRGDTIVPPSAGFVGQATLGLKAGGKTFSTSVTLLSDLRRWTWTASYFCAAPPGVPAVEAAGATPVDSVSFSGTTVVVAYGSDPDPQGGKLINLPAYRFYFQGSQIRYRPGGIVDTVRFSLYRRDITAQRPDTLVFPFAPSGASGSAVVPLQPGPTPRYVGGSWCDPAFYAVRSPVTLTAN